MIMLRDSLLRTQIGRHDWSEQSWGGESKDSLTGEGDVTSASTVVPSERGLNVALLANFGQTLRGS